MSESPAAERWKTPLVVMTLGAAVAIAVVAALQVDANIRASQANRDAQVIALLIAGELQQLGLQANYDIEVLGDALKDAKEAEILRALAQSLAASASPADAGLTLARADALAARAAKERSFSVFFSDARYKARTLEDLPNLQDFLSDLHLKNDRALERQQAAARAYAYWGRKSDNYTSGLTLLAVSAFLFGLAQALAARFRLLLGLFGLIAAAAGALWSLAVFLR